MMLLVKNMLLNTGTDTMFQLNAIVASKTNTEQMTEVEKSGKHETVIGNSREKFGIGGINYM